MNKHISRKTFLIYLLQFPFLGSVLKALNFVQPETRYLLNKFAVAGFCFYEGEDKLEQMVVGEKITLVTDPENEYDDHAIELHWQNIKIGFVPRSDNHHLFRLIEQGVSLECTIEEINPNEVTWQMCKVKVEMVG